MHLGVLNKTLCRRRQESLRIRTDFNSPLFLTSCVTLGRWASLSKATGPPSASLRCDLCLFLCTKHQWCNISSLRAGVRTKWAKLWGCLTELRPPFLKGWGWGAQIDKHGPWELGEISLNLWAFLEAGTHFLPPSWACEGLGGRSRAHKEIANLLF